MTPFPATVDICAGPTSSSPTSATSASPSAARRRFRPEIIPTSGAWSAAARPRWPPAGGHRAGPRRFHHPFRCRPGEPPVCGRRLPRPASRALAQRPRGTRRRAHPPAGPPPTPSSSPAAGRTPAWPRSPPATPSAATCDERTTGESLRSLVDSGRLRGEAAAAGESVSDADARKHWAVAVNGTRRYRTRESTPARGTLHGLPRRRCAAVGSRRLMPSLLVGGLLAACSSVGSQHRAQTGVLSSASLSA